MTNTLGLEGAAVGFEGAALRFEDCNAHLIHTSSLIHTSTPQHTYTLFIYTIAKTSLCVTAEVFTWITADKFFHDIAETFISGRPGHGLPTLLGPGAWGLGGLSTLPRSHLPQSSPLFVKRASPHHYQGRTSCTHYPHIFPHHGFCPDTVHPQSHTPHPTPYSVLKLLSVDPANYKDAPREGIRRVLEEATGVPHPRSAPLDTSRIASIRMGTTVATNALLERQGERCALLVTAGFPDLLHIANQSRPNIFDLEVWTHGV
eukprot:186650-Chlamydomonas_euryale.AAC.3